MIIKKILHIDRLRFLLPDDFTGSASDALRLCADYLDIPKYPILQPDYDPDCSNTLTNDKAFEEFVDVVANGRKLFAIMSLLEWNGEKWDELPLKTGGGL